MSRPVRCILAFVIAWSLQSGVSFAEMDWWDRASGPGPFKGFFLHYRFLCVSKPDDTLKSDADVRFTPLLPWDRTASALNAPYEFGRWANARARKQPYVTLAQVESNADARTRAAYDCKSDKGVRGYFEFVYRRSVSLENDLRVDRAQVHVVSLEVAYAQRFSRAFDFSLGTGMNWFDARRRGWDGKLEDSDQPLAFASFRRVSITPSIIYKPLAAAGEGPRARAISVQAGATIFLRGFHARDFCEPPATCTDPTWQTHGADVIPMVRVLIDGSLLWWTH